MEAQLEAVKREQFGKNAARRLRRAGRIPAVLYGGGSDGGPDPAPLAVDPKALMDIFHTDSGVNTLIGLKTPGAGVTKVLVKEYQLHPLTHRLLHADFYRVSMDKPIMVTVPFLIRGEAPGVKQEGGLLDFVRREIDLECLPSEIPEHIEVNVGDLALGDGIRLRDLVQDVAWKPVTDLETLVVHVVAPRTEAAEEEEAAAAAEEATAEKAGEPEMIKKGRPEEGEPEKG